MELRVPTRNVCYSVILLTVCCTAPVVAQKGPKPCGDRIAGRCKPSGPPPPLAISVSGPVSVASSDGAPISVTYTNATLSGGVAPYTGPSCSPARGSSFPVGTTTVTCSGSDSVGQVASASFPVAVTYTAPAPPPPDPTVVPPIPELANWEWHMVQYGAQHCDPGSIAWAIGSHGVQTEGNVWYYDGTKVYQQIAEYTQNPDWYTCAAYTNSAYKSWVQTVSQSALGGWRVFPHGLANDYRRTGDPSSKDSAIRLALYSAFAWSGGSPICGLSRETAYVLNAYVVAEELGEPRHPMYATAVDNLLSQLQKSFVTNECTFVVPFMMGLTMEALIHHYEHSGDTRVLPAIETAADQMWARYWNADAEAFFFTSDLTEVAPDVNLLIAPAYAWLWQKTGAPRHLDRGDAVFAGGVRQAWLDGGKHFSQNYRSSFDYVKWRSQAPGTIQPLTRY
jgi:hypothetical protein